MVGLAIVVLTFYRRLRRASADPEFRVIALVVAVLLAVGTMFYTNVEGWSVLDSLYFCVITLATVGYGDFAPHTSLGKVFTMVYLLLGIGVIVAFADRLVRGKPGDANTTGDMGLQDAGDRPKKLRSRAREALSGHRDPDKDA